MSPEPATSPRKPARQCVSERTETARSGSYEDDLDAALRASARSSEYLARRARLPRAGSTSAGSTLARRAGREDLAALPERALRAARRRTASPTRPASRRTASSALKSFFRFLYAARLPAPRPVGAARAAAAREAPAAGDPDTERGAPDRRGAAARDAASGCATARSSRRSTPPGIRASELVQPHAVRRRHRGAARCASCCGKGGKDRNVPLTRAAAARDRGATSRRRPRSAPRAAPASAAWLFLGRRAAAGSTARTLDEHRPARWAQKAGVKKHVTCHTFRHSVATHLLQGRRRHPAHPGAPRPRAPRDDRALHARRDLGPASGGAACAPARPLNARSAASGVPRGAARRRLLGFVGVGTRARCFRGSSIT